MNITSDSEGRHCKRSLFGKKKRTHVHYELFPIICLYLMTAPLVRCIMPCLFSLCISETLYSIIHRETCATFAIIVAM